MLRPLARNELGSLQLEFEASTIEDDAKKGNDLFYDRQSRSTKEVWREIV